MHTDNSHIHLQMKSQLFVLLINVHRFLFLLNFQVTYSRPWFFSDITSSLDSSSNNFSIAAQLMFGLMEASRNQHKEEN